MLGPLLAMPSGQGLNTTLLAILKVNGTNWLLVLERNWSCGKMFLLLTRYHYWLDNITCGRNALQSSHRIPQGVRIARLTFLKPFWHAVLKALEEYGEFMARKMFSSFPVRQASTYVRTSYAALWADITGSQPKRPNFFVWSAGWVGVRILYPTGQVIPHGNGSKWLPRRDDLMQKWPIFLGPVTSRFWAIPIFMKHVFLSDVCFSGQCQVRQLLPHWLWK